MAWMVVDDTRRARVAVGSALRELKLRFVWVFIWHVCAGYFSTCLEQDELKMLNARAVMFWHASSFCGSKSRVVAGPPPHPLLHAPLLGPVVT